MASARRAPRRAARGLGLLLVLAARHAACDELPYHSCFPAVVPRLHFARSSVPVDRSGEGEGEACPAENCLQSHGTGHIVWRDILPLSGEVLAMRLAALNAYFPNNRLHNGKYPLAGDGNTGAPFGSLNMAHLDPTVPKHEQRTNYELMLGSISAARTFHPRKDVPAFSLTIFDIDNLPAPGGETEPQTNEVLCIDMTYVQAWQLSADTRLRAFVRDAASPQGAPFESECAPGELYVSSTRADAPNPGPGQEMLTAEQAQTAISLRFYEPGGVERIHFGMHTPCTRVRAAPRPAAARAAPRRARSPRRSHSRTRPGAPRPGPSRVRRQTARRCAAGATSSSPTRGSRTLAPRRARAAGPMATRRCAAVTARARAAARSTGRCTGTSGRRRGSRRTSRSTPPSA